MIRYYTIIRRYYTISKLYQTIRILWVVSSRSFHWTWRFGLPMCQLLVDKKLIPLNLIGCITIGFIDSWKHLIYRFVLLYINFLLLVLNFQPIFIFKPSVAMDSSNRFAMDSSKISAKKIIQREIKEIRKNRYHLH